MSVDLQWLLLALPITFGLGWLASRLDWRQMQRDEKRSPRAYFKGLTHLLNEQPDQAIDAFIEVVQNDPDTTELHFALGNLFRKRGEFERAVRVHQHLLARADLKAEDRQRAQYALAQDYIKAGLFDRAEDALHPLLGGDLADDARYDLLQLHERARNWPAAIDMAQALNQKNPGAFDARIAHHWCERADDHAAQGDLAHAAQALDHARQAAPNSLRVALQTAQLSERIGDAAGALAQCQHAAKQHPQAMGLIAASLAKFIRGTSAEGEVRAQLEAAYERLPSLDVLDAWAVLAPGLQAVQARYAHHLRERPSVAAAAALVRAAPEVAAQEPHFRAVLQQASELSRRYRCAACGFESQRHFWQCPGCLSWDSFPPHRAEES